MGLQTIETYNAQNQIASIEKKKEDKTLAFEEKYYDRNGKLALQIDTVYAPFGETREMRTRWEHDSRGLVKKWIEAEGTLDAKITQYAYTPRKELETVIKPDGTILSYRYNDLGHLESLTSSDGTVNHQMKYNRLGHLQESGALVRKTDPFGRILSETFPHGHAIQNSYDRRGRRETCSIPRADCFIAYEYDPAHLKKVIRKKRDGMALYFHTYTSHDLSGNVLAEELIQGAGVVQFSVDPLSRKTALRFPHFTQEVLEFDAVGNIRKMRIEEEEIAYTYDDLYQLTSESGLFAHTYAFDSLYNRLQKDSEKYEIDALNGIPSHLQYDKNGNPVQYNSATYSYDALDRLIRIEGQDSIQTFTYDCLHRCLSKTISQKGEQKTLFFLYDGQNEIGAFDESLKPTELRILGQTPHAERGAAIAIELHGKVHIPLHDLQGNLALLQPIGEEATLYRYSAFGEEKIIGEAISPWRFSSKRTDPETGLVNFGRRFYIPPLGRWLTPDPAGFINGANLYAFVHNDPLTHFDEYGLFEALPWDYSSYKYYAWSRSSWNKPPPIHFRSGLNSQHSPLRYVNGILNTPIESMRGANSLAKAFAGRANIIPFYSESWGTLKDLFSVNRSRKNPNYTSFTIRRLNRELQWDMHCLEAMNDPRKLFVNCFSRGAADTYHACKNFTAQQRDRLIITACGPIMTLPRNLGFRVMNLISEGDWCSLHYHKGLLKDRKKFEYVADVFLLSQKDGYSGFIRDHFFKSKTYQEGIQDFTLELYKKHGFAK